MIFMKSIVLERGTNKKKKFRNIALYQNFYPFNLYVITIDDWDIALEFFDFFSTIEKLRSDKPGVEVSKLEGAAAATYLVREKRTRSVGALIVLDDAGCSTLAHESIHFSDALYDYLGMYSTGYDDGNEQYAYLVTWCVECLEQFVEWKERKTTEETIKQDGN